MNYSDYWQKWGPHANEPQGSEGSGSFHVLSEDEWNQLSAKDKYQAIAAGDILDADPALSQEFRNKFGASTWDPSLAGNLKNEGGNKVVWSYYPPNIYGKADPEWMIDPNRVLEKKDAEGNTIYAYETNNIKGDFQAAQQAQSADSGFFHGDKWDLAKIAAVFAGGYGLAGLAGEGALAAGAGEGLGEAAAGTGAFDASGVTPSLYGGEVAPYAADPSILDLAGNEVANTYTPGANPTDFSGTPDWNAPGSTTDWTGVDDVGNPIEPGNPPGRYDPNWQGMPTDFSPEAPLGQSWWDKITDPKVLDTISKLLPSVAKGLTPLATAGGRGASAGAGGISVPAMHGNKAASDANPFIKRPAVETGSLMHYLRGGN